MSTVRELGENLFAKNTSVNAGGSVTSPVFDVRYRETIASLIFQLASAGTPDVKIEWCGSADGVTFDAFTDHTPITSSTNTDFAATPKGVHAYPWPAILYPFIKVRVTGVNANPADTTIQLMQWFYKENP